MMKPQDNKIERGQSRTRVKKHRTLRNTMEVKMSVGDGNTVKRSPHFFEIDI